ncbi:uncharacterized protein [Prorops nasuta]|uniref:uncharacterized protein n=1 Tax=Prorops nasuta TaxID=863751 RepID=UPI0034CE3536
MARASIFQRSLDFVAEVTRSDNTSKLLVKIKEEPLDNSYKELSVTTAKTETSNVLTQQAIKRTREDKNDFLSSSLDNASDSTNCHLKNDGYRLTRSKSLSLNNFKINLTKELVEEKKKTKVYVRNTRKKPRLELDKILLEGKYCPVCFIEIKSIRQYELHESAYNITNPSIFCKICNMGFNTKLRWQWHTVYAHKHNIQDVKNSKFVYCNFCSQLFSSKKTLQCHLFHYHGQDILKPSVTSLSDEAIKSKLKVTPKGTLDKENKNNLEAQTADASSTTNRNPVTEDEQSSKIQMKRQNNDSSSSQPSPSKKLRQTTLMEFLSNKSKPNDNCLTSISKESLDSNFKADNSASNLPETLLKITRTPHTFKMPKSSTDCATVKMNKRYVLNSPRTRSQGVKLSNGNDSDKSTESPSNVIKSPYSSEEPKLNMNFPTEKHALSSSTPSPIAVQNNKPFVKIFVKHKELIDLIGDKGNVNEASCINDAKMSSDRNLRSMSSHKNINLSTSFCGPHINSMKNSNYNTPSTPLSILNNRSGSRHSRRLRSSLPLSDTELCNIYNIKQLSIVLRRCDEKNLVKDQTMMNQEKDQTIINQEKDQITVNQDKEEKENIDTSTSFEEIDIKEEKQSENETDISLRISDTVSDSPFQDFSISLDKIDESTSTVSESPIKIVSDIKLRNFNVSLVRLNMNESKSDSGEAEKETLNTAKFYVCKVCNEEFDTKETRKYHTSLLHTAYMSSICQARFTMKSKLMEHFYRIHTPSNSLECCVCNEITNDSSSLKRHLLLHCLKYTVTNTESMTLNDETRCEYVTKKYECVACNKKFRLLYSFEQHRKVCKVWTDMMEAGSKAKEIDNKTPTSPIKSTESKNKISADSCGPIESCKEQSASSSNLMEPNNEKSTNSYDPAEQNDETSINSYDSAEQTDQTSSNSSQSMKLHLETPTTNLSSTMEPYNETSTDSNNTLKPNSNVTANLTESVHSNGETSNNFIEAVEEDKAMSTDSVTAGDVNHELSPKKNRNSQPNQVPSAGCIQVIELSDTISISSDKTDDITNGVTFPNSNNIEMLTVVPDFISNNHVYENDKYFVPSNSAATQSSSIFNKSVNIDKIKKAMNKNKSSNAQSDTKEASNYVEISESDSSYMCGLCDRKYKTKESLLAHTNSYIRCSKVLCEICGTHFARKRQLERHIKKTHSTSTIGGYIKHCRYCNEGFKQLPTHFEHEMHLHQKERVFNPAAQNQPAPDEKFICITCNAFFNNFENFKDHKLYYYDANRFICKFCGQAYYGMFHYHRHIKKYHCPEEVKQSFVYKCVICHEGFKNQMHFYSHQVHVHGAPKAVVPSQIIHGNILQLSNESNPEQTQQELPIDIDGHTPDVLIYMYDSNQENGPEKLTTNPSFQSNAERLNLAPKDLGALAETKRTGEPIDVAKARNVQENKNPSTEVIDKPGSVSTLHNLPKRGPTFEEQNAAYKEIPQLSFTGCQAIELLPIYNCDLCDIEFENIRELTSHQQNFSDFGDYRCKKCSRRFRTYHRLQDHDLINHQVTNNSPICNVCNERFLTTTILQCHINHFHNARCTPSSNDSATDQPQDKSSLKKTSVIPNAFRIRPIDMATLLNANALKGKKNGVFVCIVCGKRFNNVREHIRHQKEYNNKGDFFCATCNRRFDEVSFFKKHMEKHSFRKKFSKFLCCICKESFNDIVDLSCHSLHLHGPTGIENVQQNMDQNHTLVVTQEKNLKSVQNHTLVVTKEKNLNSAQNHTLVVTQEKNLNSVENHTLVVTQEKNLKSVQNHTLVVTQEKNLNSAQNHTLVVTQEKNLNSVENHTLVVTQEKNLKSVQNHTLVVTQEKNLNSVENHTLVVTQEENLNSVENHTLVVTQEKNLNSVQNHTLVVTQEKSLKSVQNHTLVVTQEKNLNSAVIPFGKKSIETNTVTAAGSSHKVSNDPLINSTEPITSQQPVKVRYECDVCKIHFCRQSSLDRHKNRYKNVGSYHCTLCKENFTLEAAYMNHLNRHFSTSNEFGWTCLLCKDSFRSYRETRSHISHCHGIATSATIFIAKDCRLIKNVPVETVSSAASNLRLEDVASNPSLLNGEIPYLCNQPENKEEDPLYIEQPETPMTQIDKTVGGLEEDVGGNLNVISLPGSSNGSLTNITQDKQVTTIDETESDKNEVEIIQINEGSNSNIGKLKVKSFAKIVEDLSNQIP